MSEDLQPKLEKPNPLMRRAIICAAVLLVVFLLGFVPMWLKARSATSRLVDSERQNFLVSTQSNLAGAVVDARRGDYEPARQAVSQFFTSLRAEIDKGDASNLNPAQRQGAQSLFAGRDETITLLARSDPASADRLSDLFVAYRRIMNTPATS
jgi:hypothetical protein